MIEKILKAVKSSNKKRGKNITVGAVLGMLLSCTVVMGEDIIGLEITNNGSSEIKFSKDGVEFIPGKEENPNTNKDPYIDNTWKNNTYTNNTTISGKSLSGNGYGIKIDGESKKINFDFINKGAIFGESISDSNFGYGIEISNLEEGSNFNLINNGLISVIGRLGKGILISTTVGKIINIGVINGRSEAETSSSYGIELNSSSKIENATNKGIINLNAVNSRGITVYSAKNRITNNGVINARATNSAYGIYTQSLNILNNNGVVNSYGDKNSRGINISLRTLESSFGYITNTGVIYGKEKGISIGSNTTVRDAYNYGIIVSGEETVLSNLTAVDTIEGKGENKILNYGLVIKNDGTIEGKSVNTEGKPIEVIIEHDSNGTKLIKEMIIENKIDTTGTDSFKGNRTDSILNALKNTYEVDDSSNITNSIINAYEETIIFTGVDKVLTLFGTFVNGGIKADTVTIKGSTGADTLILKDGTVINGKISMGTGSDNITIENGVVINGDIVMGTEKTDGAIAVDTIPDNNILTIENGVQINGALNGGIDSSEDILNFNGSSSNEEIRILHDISNFEKINIGTNVTFYENNLEVTDVENLTISKNGVLTLRIDTANGNAHALTGNTGTIKSVDGGKLLLALNGAGKTNTISFGDFVLDESLVTGHEGTYKDDVTLETTSALHSVKRTEENNEIEITAKVNLPPSLNKSYEKLNKVYKSLLNEVGNFNVVKDDNDKSMSLFLAYLNDIYAGNPYSYSSELSRKSAGMFRDIVTENQFKPNLNKWMIYGGLTHVDVGTKDTYYGKGCYTYDIGSSDIDTDSKITGAYMLGEYGVSDTLTSGVIIGGNKLKSDLSNGSKVDGSALYLGAYTKKYIGNLKVTAGAGFQYGDYDTDRLAVNKVASSTAEPVMKYSDSYNDVTYDIYLNGRYSNPMRDNFFLEPYATLSYTYVDQDGADEGNKVLAIETDSKSFDYTVGKVGVDLKKVIPHEKGKSTVSAGISYTKMLDGAEEEYITGRFKGGTDFDILVAHKNEHSIGLNAKYVLELENGALLDVKGTYSIERDSHNGSGKNRTKGEWIVGAGLGYKF
ncbi:hypothetical protein F350042L8_25920 [Fusobacterium ulcerans]|uniref:autotransporter family protein n=1 Tax=Fusobacterium ulcerans TaxID=861 RepID=UPI0034AD188F